jgi:hypothetical protein
MVDRKWTTKYKTLMTSSKIPEHLRLHRVTRWHPRSAPCMTMMCLPPIQFPPPATSSLFKVLIVEVPHIPCCFQTGLMGLTRKEMHMFQPWETLTCSMQLLSAYKRLPPIRCLHPNHGSCSNHRQVCLEDRCVSNLLCIQRSLLQILPHVFNPPILRKVKMISSLLACSLSKGIIPRWHQKWPCRRAMSLLKRPILLLLNKVAPPVTCNQCKGYIHASIASGSSHRSIPYLHEIEV